MLSYHHHSTGHRVIRVCCAAAAAHRHKSWLKHPHTDTTKVTHIYSTCEIDVICCIVGLTSVLSSSGPYTSQEPRLYSNVSVLKLLKRRAKSEDLHRFIFDILAVMSYHS